MFQKIRAMVHFGPIRVSKRILAIGCVTVIGLLITCLIQIDNFESVGDSCATGEEFVSTLTRLKKQSNSSGSSVFRHKTSSHKSSFTFTKLITPPVTVYYIWCQSQYFEFRHYLSVKSTIQYLKPDHVILYYLYYPHIDSQLYNTWLSELQQEFSFFETVKAPGGSCYRGKPSMSFILQLTSERGGIYLGENTILTRPLPTETKAVTSAVREDSNDIDILVVNSKLSCKPDARIVLLSDDVQFLNCSLVSGIENAAEEPACFVLDRSIFPKHIWHLNTVFGRFARRLFYGSSDVPVPKPSYDQLVPNIGHMVWFGGGRMDFLFFLGVLSLLYVAEVDTVYVHGDQPPSGYYWSLLRDNPRVIHMPRHGVHMIYGQNVESYSHKSDVLRAELLYRYGGIYLDTDAVFVRALDPEIRGYDAVGSYDWIDWNHPFPEIINLGVALGKKNGEFWRLFRESMKWFKDDDFSWNGLRRPYQVLERHPHLIRIDPHLQVICYYYKCHATWWNDFQDSSINHRNRELDWRSDAYSFHWTFPTPSELTGYDRLLKSDGMFADIGKHILNRSGLMDHFRKKLSAAHG